MSSDERKVVKCTKRKRDRAGRPVPGGGGGRGNGGGAPRRPVVPKGLGNAPRPADLVSYGAAVAVAGGLKAIGFCSLDLCSGGVVDTALSIGVPVGTMLAVGWRLLLGVAIRRGEDEPPARSGGPSGRGGGGTAKVRRLPTRRRKANGGPAAGGSSSGEGATETAERPASAQVVPSMWPPIESAGGPRDAD